MKKTIISIIITSQVLLAQSVNITYNYDNISRLTSVSYTTGQSVGYTYDSAGNITNVAVSGGEVNCDDGNPLTIDSYNSSTQQCENILDSDGDGYSNKAEILAGTDPNDPNSKICTQVITHAYNPQTGEERDFATPCDVLDGWIEGYAPDSDGDGINDIKDTDDDNDGISDIDEERYGLNPQDSIDANEDSDGDGVSNKDEILNGTDPNDPTDAQKDNLSLNVDIEELIFYKQNQEYNLSIEIDSIYEDDLNLSVKSQKDTLIIQKSWSDLLNLADYSDANLTLNIRVKDDIDEKNDSLILDLRDKHNNIITKEINITILKSYDLYIDRGWSIKSIPVDREIGVDDFNESKIIWKWDSEDGKWLAWSSDSNIMNILRESEKKGVYGVFDTIKPSEGFWIYSEKVGIKSFNGNSYGVERLNLKEGWNLVGVGKGISVNELKDRNIKYTWQYDNGKWRVWGEDLSEDVYKRYEKIENIKPTEGFWVFVE